MNIMVVITVLALSGNGPANSPHTVDSLVTLSRTYWYNDPDSARYHLEAALVLARDIGYRKGEADALKGLGFLSKSNVERLEKYIQSLDIRLEIKDSIGIGVSLYDLGSLYGNMGDTTKMIDYYQRSYEVRKKINDHGGIALCHIGFGHFDERLGDYFGALNNYRAALVHRIIANDPNGIAFAYINIAQAKLLLHENDSAIVYATMAEELFAKANNKTNVDWPIWIKSKSLFQLGQFDEALALLSKREEAAGLNEEGLLLKSEILETLRDYKNALSYYHKWLRKKENADISINASKLQSLTADYEFKLKQEELRLVAAEQQRIKRRADNLQLLAIALIIIVVFIAIVLIRKKASPRVLNTLSFAAFLFLFEYVIVLADPTLQAISENKPFLVFVGNVAIALLLAPLHNLVDTRFRKTFRLTG